MQPDATRRLLAASVLAVVLALVALPTVAGLRFVPADAPGGAETRALAADAAGLWAGTSRGVWRYAEGLWRLDGLGAKAIRSIAVHGSSVWAATGEELYQRGADGTWTLEALPVRDFFPSTLASDGSRLYLGGIGVLSRSGSGWSTLASPGVGLVESMAFWSGNLVVGLSVGTAASLSGSTWTPLAGGVGTGERLTALVAAGSSLWAGTNRSVYAWSGAGWVVDKGFGVHEVAALAVAGGTLRAATTDVGVQAFGGSAWSADNAGLLPKGARAFAVEGGDLFLGTAGGPVYRRSGGGWSEVSGSPTLEAAHLADFAVGVDGLVSAAAGAGTTFGWPGSGAVPGGQVPPGCGNVHAAVATALPSAPVLLATGCGPLAGGLSGWSSTSAGLPATAAVTTLAATSAVVLGGTRGSGLFRFGGASWSAEPLPGLPDRGTVQALRAVGNDVYAALSEGMFLRSGAGWADASAGLSSPASVLSLAGRGATVFAGLVAGGVLRRDAGAAWQADATGVASQSVPSIDVSSGILFAAAASGGVFRKGEGAWAPETAGLPAGVDVRVVRHVTVPAGVVGASPPGLAVGTAGHGAFFAATDATVRTLPVVLDVVGATGARFRTELTIGNRSDASVFAVLTFRPAPGFGAPQVAPGTVTLSLAPRAELRAADALEFLRSRGLAVPVATPDRPIAGSLALEGNGAGSTSPLYAIARTYTEDAQGGGSYGLFYDGPSDVDAAEEEAWVASLRSVPGEARSNLAVVHVPGRSTEPITVEVQVFGASGAAAPTVLTRSLAPGEWAQWSGVLAQAGLPEGSYGTARVRRTAGVGAFVAYGVVNDAVTSDGSYVPALRPGGLGAARVQVVPVVLDVYGAAGSRYTTELTLVNGSVLSTPVDLVYRPAPGYGSSGGVPVVTVDVGARAQVTIPDVVQYLRDNGVTIPQAEPGSPQAGTLTVTFRYLTNLDGPSTLALARTTTAGPGGGRFGLFYAAVPKGGGTRGAAIVPALRRDDAFRSNLAVVGLGGGSELRLRVRVTLFDAASGQAVGKALALELSPGDWAQWSGVFDAAEVPAGVGAVYALVERTSGDDTFFAYGVVNDNVTSDGSYIPMIGRTDL